MDENEVLELTPEEAIALIEDAEGNSILTPECEAYHREEHQGGEEQ